MPVRYKKYSSVQIFKTSLAFLEYRRFEARRAVVCCSLSAYEQRKLPGRSSTGRTLYAFYSRCKISASEAPVCAEREISIFWVKKSWHFYLSLSLLPTFFFILVQFFGPGNLLGLISDWASFPRETFWGTQDLRDKKEELQVGSEGFSSPFSAQRYIFFCLFIRPP